MLSINYYCCCCCCFTTVQKCLLKWCFTCLSFCWCVCTLKDHSFSFHYNYFTFSFCLLFNVEKMCFFDALEVKFKLFFISCNNNSFEQVFLSVQLFVDFLLRHFQLKIEAISIWKILFAFKCNFFARQTLAWAIASVVVFELYYLLNVQVCVRFPVLHFFLVVFNIMIENFAPSSGRPSLYFIYLIKWKLASFSCAQQNEISFFISWICFYSCSWCRWWASIEKFYFYKNEVSLIFVKSWM